MEYLVSVWYVYNMVVTRRFVTGSSSGSGEGGQEAPITPETIIQKRPDKMDDRIREILYEEVAAIFWA